MGSELAGPIFFESYIGILALLIVEHVFSSHRFDLRPSFGNFWKSRKDRPYRSLNVKGGKVELKHPTGLTRKEKSLLEVRMRLRE